MDFPRLDIADPSKPRRKRADPLAGQSSIPSPTRLFWLSWTTTSSRGSEVLSDERDDGTQADGMTGLNVSNIPCMHVYTGSLLFFAWLRPRAFKSLFLTLWAYG
jgi:hypothetical protein